MSSTEDSVDATEQAATDPNIVRMYRTDDAGALVFREAWVDAGDTGAVDENTPDASAGDASTGDASTAGPGAPDAGGEAIWFVLNHGTVGRQSTSQETAVDSAEEAFALLAAFKDQGLADGYAELAREEQFIVVAQFALKNARITDRDKYLEEKAREALTAHLAWRGSGIVEKTEFTPGPHSTGKLNIHVLAPDAARAVANIKVCIREEKLDFTKLSIGTAPANDPAALKAKHSPSGSSAFSL